MNRTQNRRLDSRIIAGILLILIGSLIFIDRSGIAYFSIFDILALVAVLGGSVQLIQAQHHRHFREGAWWLFLGIWFYLSYHQIGGYGFSDTWPMLIIVWGIGHIWKALEPQKNFNTVKD